MNPKAPARLSPRQREIMRLVCRGKCDKEIADQLGIAKRTVEEHMKITLQRLGAVNRPHAVWLFTLA